MLPAFDVKRNALLRVDGAVEQDVFFGEVALGPGDDGALDCCQTPLFDALACVVDGRRKSCGLQDIFRRLGARSSSFGKYD